MIVNYGVCSRQRLFDFLRVVRGRRLFTPAAVSRCVSLNLPLEAVVAKKESTLIRKLFTSRVVYRQ